MANVQRYYHDVKDLPSAKEAIRQLTDHTYELRDRLARQEADHAKLQRAHADTKTHLQRLQSGVNSQLSGINVSGSPDATNIHLAYNPATGQLEWEP